ncbi:MAG TPA: YbhB/YbcL family Raf kinase inhibitor-like protein [Chthonomonadaceae bacterium]|nr:YbhB/YbcL family Raf kinase inhibitor-like protein [Chthonomonadaceae bacterium]
MAFTLTSTAFAEGQNIPQQYTCDGDDRSPDLAWSGAPNGTHSYALIVHDPDAPRGDFTHWVLYDITARVEKIPEGGKLPQPAAEGKNDFGKTGYGGPCPPPRHGPHRYIFTVYALSVETLGLPAGASRADVEAAMQGNILGQAQLVGRYERK